MNKYDWYLSHIFIIGLRTLVTIAALNATSGAASSSPWSAGVERRVAEEWE